MSIKTYLENKANNAIIRDKEKDSIKKSIETIQNRLDKYFDDKLEEHFEFGSYTRNTILPRSDDLHSDIDYMVVFKDNSYTPQTYLDKLKQFVGNYYSKSEIKQSHPTIRLELNHITFELVPAINNNYSGYSIPLKTDGEDTWIPTNPNEFNKELTTSNKNNNSLIKLLVRLLKIWNAKHDYVYESYLLEKDIIEKYFFFFTRGEHIKDYFYNYIESINIDDSLAQFKKSEIEKLKEKIAQAKEKEENNNSDEAENIICQIFKDELSKQELFSKANNYDQISHKAIPPWNLPNNSALQINARYKKPYSNGSSFNSNTFLEKNCQVIFNCSNPYPKNNFEVYWQITNTGYEATQANNLRGDICKSETAGIGELSQTETTAYTGTHFVQCFLVKDDECIAQSEEFIVKIK